MDRFLSTNHGYINSRFIVRIYRDLADDDHCFVEWLQDGTNLKTSSADVLDVHNVIGIWVYD